jgi:hypothetical protein
MTMTGFVSTYLVHPHIDNKNVWKCQTKQRFLFLEYLLVSISLLRIKTLCINDVKIVYTMQPNTFSTSLSSDSSIKDRKFCTKCIV